MKMELIIVLLTRCQKQQRINELIMAVKEKKSEST